MRETVWHYGLKLFNSRRYFEAHEVLEDLWRDAPLGSALRRHLQGMVQLAVAFHHQSTGNRVGARSVLERALGNLDGVERSFPLLDWRRLRDCLEPWRTYLAADPPSKATSAQRPGASSPPVLPKVLLRSDRQ